MEKRGPLTRARLIMERGAGCRSAESVKAACAGNVSTASELRALADHAAGVLLELEALVGRLADEAIACPAGKLRPDHKLWAEPLGVAGDRSRNGRRERRL